MDRDINTAPTKGNLRAAKNTLQLSRLGYELMDKKRSILIKEIMELADKAREVQYEAETVFKEAYAALKAAIVEQGSEAVFDISCSVAVEGRLALKSRSVMGVPLPVVTYNFAAGNIVPFDIAGSTAALDETYVKFNKAKELALKLAVLDNTAHRLAVNIKKTGKRANALKNITIPKYEALIKHIQEMLEERERDEFTRLKVVKELQKQ